MNINLNECTHECHQCIKSYISKHNLKKKKKVEGESLFKLQCTGILKDPMSDSILAITGSDKETALNIYDPVSWAAKFLDWHCIDPIGEIWQRKTLEGTLNGAPPYDHERAVVGKSIYHRPYQKIILQCSSQYKVLRLGRQLGKTESLCISMLHSMFTNDKFKIVFVAPYQAQVDLVFSRLVELIHNSPTLRDSIARKTKAPNYTLELKNGSFVHMFTAGTRSGQEAGSVRGQTGRILVLDEADMLNAKDVDAMLAVIMNFPNATVWMSSTPTGKRETFYSCCFDPQYKEFHFPSSVNPNWDKDKEAFFRSRHTEEGYCHEIDADFGSQEEGVFKPKYVEAAMDDYYTYDQMSPQPGWIYMFGVDWNDYKNGNTIIVVGYNPKDGLFYVVDKSIISTTQFTQLNACQKITELNRIWNPEAIYVDKGYGHGAIEVLHKFGYDAIADKNRGAKHADGRLASIVKPYDFSSKVETYDLFTKQPLNKPAKPFLIENAVRRFETHTIRFPANDSKMKDTLLGYIIKSVSQTGAPTYTAQNEAVGDHLLDALALGLVAFTLEKTEFGKPKFEISIGFTGRIGEATIAPQTADRDRPREDYRPTKGRTETMGTNKTIQNHGMPMGNTRYEPQVGLWAWPGFMRDAPKPRVRSLGEAWAQAERKVLGKAPSRMPRRKKF